VNTEKPLQHLLFIFDIKNAIEIIPVSNCNSNVRYVNIKLTWILENFKNHFLFAVLDLFVLELDLSIRNDSQSFKKHLKTFKHC